MATVIVEEAEKRLKELTDAGIEFDPISVKSIPPKLKKPLEELKELKDLLEKEFEVDKGQLFPHETIQPSEALLYYQLSNKKNQNIKVVLSTMGFMDHGINHVGIYFNKEVFPVYDHGDFEHDVLNHTMFAWKYLEGFGPGISIPIGTPKQQYKWIMSYVQDVLNYVEKTPKEKIKAALEISDRMRMR